VLVEGIRLIWLSSKAPTLFIELVPAAPFRTLPRPLDLGALISRRLLVPRHVSPHRVNENILHS
jgi:hypothetical protein